MEPAWETKIPHARVRGSLGGCGGVWRGGGVTVVGALSLSATTREKPTPPTKT